jgi:hypothetical protein
VARRWTRHVRCGTFIDGGTTDDDATTMMTLQPAYDEDFLFLILMRSLCNGMDGRLLLHYGMGGNNVAVVLYVVG